MSLRAATGEQLSRASAGEDHLLLQEGVVKNGNTILSLNSTMNSKGKHILDVLQSTRY